MSRIIDKNYTNKLNSILELIDFPDKLKKIIDFLKGEVESDLSRNFSKSQKVFSKKDLEFQQKLNESKLTKRIFKYLHNLINSFDRNFLQIHLNIDSKDIDLSQIIFLLSWEFLISSRFNENHLIKEINDLKEKTNKPLKMPSDNNKYLSDQIFKSRREDLYKIKFLEKILYISKLKHDNCYGCLINANRGASKTFKIPEYFVLPKPTDINSYLNNSLLNFGDSLQNIYDNNQSKLSKVGTIINLFPAVTGSNIWYQDFIAENINNWNLSDEFDFKKVITITSGAKTPESLTFMRKQNKFQAEEIYTIFPFELDN